MNSETGQILSLTKAEQRLYNEKLKKGALRPLEEIFGLKNGVPNMIPVEKEDLIEKQEKNMQVSKHDNRSVLGKKFTESRQVRKRKERDALKNANRRLFPNEKKSPKRRY